jgi:hypothetical protein
VHKVDSDDAIHPTIDVTVAVEPVAEAAAAEPPRILANASSTSSLNRLVPRESGSSLTGSQLLREELWNAKESLAVAEDAASVASDVSSVSVSKKAKKKTFFSFGRKKEKQKEIM